MWIFLWFLFDWCIWLIADAEFAQRLEPNNQEIKKQHADLRAFVGKVSLALIFKMIFVKSGSLLNYLLVNVGDKVMIFQMCSVCNTISLILLVHVYISQAILEKASGASRSSPKDKKMLKKSDSDAKIQDIPPVSSSTSRTGLLAARERVEVEVSNFLMPMVSCIFF